MGSGIGGGAAGLAVAIMARAGVNIMGPSQGDVGLAHKGGGGGGVGEVGVIPAQTQLSTSLAINLGTEGKPVGDPM